jgi:hypothetical protein
MLETTTSFDRILKKIHLLTALALWLGIAVSKSDHTPFGIAEENRDEWLLIESPSPEPEMEPWRKELHRKLQEPMSTEKPVEEPQKRDLSEAEVRAARERTAGQNAARNLVEKEALRLKAPTGFAGAKWLMSPEEVKGVRPKVRAHGDGQLFEAMEWLGRPAAVTYVFDDGLFVEAVVIFSGATEADFNKTQAYLQNAHGKMPEPIKTEKHLLSSTYKEGRFSILHLLWPNKMDGVTFFRTK